MTQIRKTDMSKSWEKEEIGNTWLRDKRDCRAEAEALG